MQGKGLFCCHPPPPKKRCLPFQLLSKGVASVPGGRRDGACTRLEFGFSGAEPQPHSLRKMHADPQANVVPSSPQQLLLQSSSECPCSTLCGPTPTPLVLSPPAGL